MDSPSAVKSIICVSSVAIAHVYPQATHVGTALHTAGIARETG
jgi:hypothetical protein